MASPSDEDGGDGDGNTMLTIHVSKSGKTLDVNLPQDALLSDLISSCEESGTWAASNDAHLDWDRAKFIAKGQLLRSGPDDHKTVSHLDGKRVTLQVPTTEDIQSLQQSSEAARARQARRQAQRRAAVPARQTRRQGDSNFTFLRIEPLPGLRNPERSREFLARLAEDPGIKAAMKKHQFTGTYGEGVGLFFRNCGEMGKEGEGLVCCLWRCSQWKWLMARASILLSEKRSTDPEKS